MAEEEEDNYIEIEEDEEEGDGEKQVWLDYLIFISISIGRNENWLKWGYERLWRYWKSSRKNEYRSRKFKKYL